MSQISSRQTAKTTPIRMEVKEINKSQNLDSLFTQGSQFTSRDQKIKKASEYQLKKSIGNF